MRQSKGFTLIELLIVIAVLGILIIAILSALDPLEQMRKARDAGRKSDAGQLLAAYERYYATFQCYPWDTGAPRCTAIVNRTTAVHPPIPGTDADLITQGELKSTFASRATITGNLLWVYEDANRNTHVCVEPESRSARQGAMGTLYNQPSATATVLTVCPTMTYPAANCYICLPQ